MSSNPGNADSVKLIVPALGGFYRSFAQPAAWVALRVAVGVILAIEGWSKMMAPMAMTGFVESIGFYPGWFWSPFLAALQFFGGLAVAVGLFTRPVALANAVMLAITFWFHAVNPYGDAFLTPAGIEALTSNSELFTPQAMRRLADGGTQFLHQVQGKAEHLSLLWALGMALFAGYGGGPLSVDRNVLKKEF
ncbi:MAG: DoxX family protein [Aquamicrobium sp.]|uniref:DoxX family protein n=1 Tax=Aquamicrobium sp. TaxID=1872579 RepID=UPI00349E75C6|nr:DoxX family protein [Aquamicrobium sp.]